LFSFSLLRTRHYVSPLSHVLPSFGTGHVRTHTIGAALVRSEWAKATSLILMPGGRRRTPAAASLCLLL
jgi:hypothetical protein